MTGTGTGATPGGDADQTPGPDVPLVVAARWAQAQGQLFGALTMQPELYERTVLVLAATTDRLRATTSTPADLLAAQDTVAELLLEQARTDGLDLEGVDPALVGLAALAQRLPEVRALAADRRRAAALAAAPAGGWVVLEESGDPAGDALAPYRRLEAQAGTGAAVLVQTDPDEQFTGARHSVQSLRVDLQTGALDPDPAGAPLITAPDAGEREAVAARLRGT